MPENREQFQFTGTRTLAGIVPPIIEDVILRDFGQAHAEELVRATERWCWKAIARGVGNRVWRSAPIYSDNTVRHRFQILAPGEESPGSGIVFGPFGTV